MKSFVTMILIQFISSVFEVVNFLTLGFSAMPMDSGEFEIEYLCEPISEEKPEGIDLRCDVSPNSLYYQIKDARSQARNIERQFDIANSFSQTKIYWQKLADLANTALAQHSKDLEIAVWLTEALVRLYHFKGLHQGFYLIRNLIAKFWDNLYPLPDAEGIENRIAPLTGLNGIGGEGTLITPIRFIPLTAAREGENYAEWQYQQAIQINQIIDPDKQKERIESTQLSLQLIEKAAQQTPTDFFQQIYHDLQRAINEFDSLAITLDEYCIAESPPTSAIKNTLQDCLTALQFLAQDKLLTQEISSNPSFTDDQLALSTLNAPILSSSSQIDANQMTREQAFKYLQQIADYFRRTEPHSPLSYTIEQTIRWGHMPLPQLLNELIPDVSTRDNFFALTGIPINAINEEN